MKDLTPGERIAAKLFEHPDNRKHAAHLIDEAIAETAKGWAKCSGDYYDQKEKAEAESAVMRVALERLARGETLTVREAIIDDALATDTGKPVLAWCENVLHHLRSITPHPYTASEIEKLVDSCPLAKGGGS